jgi:hypothetical protein
MGAGSQQDSKAPHSGAHRESNAQTLRLALDSIDELEVKGISEANADQVKIQANVASYRGRRAVRIVNDDGPAGGVSGGQVLAIVKKAVFKDGAIEADVAGLSI